MRYSAFHRTCDFPQLLILLGGGLFRQHVHQRLQVVGLPVQAVDDVFHHGLARLAVSAAGLDCAHVLFFRVFVHCRLSLVL